MYNGSLNNNDVIANVGIPSILLNQNPKVGDRFYAIVECNSGGIITLALCLVEVILAGDVDTDPFSIKLLGVQRFYRPPTKYYTKHVQVSSIAGFYNFAYKSTNPAAINANPTTVMNEIRSFSGNNAIEATGVWLVSGKLHVVTGFKAGSSSNVTLECADIFSTSSAIVTKVTTNTAMNAYTMWVETNY